MLPLCVLAGKTWTRMVGVVVVVEARLATLWTAGVYDAPAAVRPA
jgi:hypothetical protein